ISTRLLKTTDRLIRALFVLMGAEKDGMSFVETDTGAIHPCAILSDHASQNWITVNHGFPPLSLTEFDYGKFASLSTPIAGETFQNILAPKIQTLRRPLSFNSSPF